MRRKKKNHRKPITQINLNLPIDDDCSHIPYSLLGAPISEAAFSLALYLYYYREHISHKCPNTDLLMLSQKMSLDIVQCCEQELTAAGILIRHEDGTFDMKDV